MATHRYFQRWATPPNWITARRPAPPRLPRAAFLPPYRGCLFDVDSPVPPPSRQTLPQRNGSFGNPCLSPTSPRNEAWSAARGIKPPMRSPFPTSLSSNIPLSTLGSSNAPIARKRSTSCSAKTEYGENSGGVQAISPGCPQGRPGVPCGCSATCWGGNVGERPLPHLTIRPPSLPSFPLQIHPFLCYCPTYSEADQAA
jgi:hypothetical protein